ncbi:MAG: hypothetical protein AB7V14_06325 [Kiritimatiellia bacterium]
MKTALRIMTCLIGAPVILFGGLFLATTVVGYFLGGPREPPAGMAWEEFKTWTDSGRWFWEALLQAIACIAIPLLAIRGVNRWTRK